ncbi:MAG TPA: response regulator transcription factor [Rubrobacteraceae bacterium]|nr:response regulator transcription factor [Rubrobacteraceae bacterium]
MGGRRISVLLADDHTMFRQGLSEMLSTDEEIEVIAQAENGEEALALVREHVPDVVILDVEMPGPGARETMARVFEISPVTKVVIVTMFDNPRLVRELVAAGASAYLVKSASLEELLAAVHTAAHSPNENVVVAAPRGMLARVENEKIKDLTPRELETVVLVARGLSNQQIANALHISEATVKRHLANVYAKLRVSSRGETTRKALSEGWITTWDVTQRHEDGE